MFKLFKIRFTDLLTYIIILNNDGVHILWR